MTIYPAIDLKGGRCVRLLQGLADRETVYSDDPAEVAAGFRAQGATWIHVVDLDGAFGGEPRNLPVLAAILKVGLRVQMGGGLRSLEAIRRVVELGVARAVVGTRAAESEAFVAEAVREFGGRLAVGIDAKDGRVAVKGWADTTATGAVALARRMDALGVATLIHTDIGTDGMLTGPNLAAQEAMAAAVRANVIASGGVSQAADVAALRSLSVRYPNLEGVIVGKAIYEKRVNLAELVRDVRPSPSSPTPRPVPPAGR